MDSSRRVLGSFWGAAVGDAMGAATETMTPDMIRRRFGGYLDHLAAPGPGTFSEGCPAGFVTDDFSLAYFTAQAILEAGGTVDDAVARSALLRWAAQPEYFRFAGPSTASAIARLRGEALPAASLNLACDNARASNGSAMKIFPAGLMHPGDPEAAIRDAVILCAPTHSNTASLSAACAIAAAVSAAVTGAGLDAIIDAGFHGAREGSNYGAPVSVASVLRRMELAVSIGRRGLGWEAAMLELADVVGAGLSANEAVPCVFGILAACGGEPLAAIRMGVNIGNDTDTVATMVGAIVGAMYGPEIFPAQWLEQITQANALDIPAVAGAFAEVFYA